VLEAISIINMRLTKTFGLVGILCHSLAVTGQNFTDVDLQLAAYLEQNNFSQFNVTASRARDSNVVKITSLGCTIAVSSIHGRHNAE
jgi:hypothetical protein